MATGGRVVGAKPVFQLVAPQSDKSGCSDNFYKQVKSVQVHKSPTYCGKTLLLLHLLFGTQHSLPQAARVVPGVLVHNQTCTNYSTQATQKASGFLVHAVQCNTLLSFSAAYLSVSLLYPLLSSLVLGNMDSPPGSPRLVSRRKR